MYAKLQVGKLKLVLIKVKKNLNANCGSSCKSFKRFSEVAKNSSLHLRYWKEFCGSRVLLGHMKLKG